MPYWRECPGCGVRLDPGEICGDCKEKAARGATNTQDGKADRDLTSPVSASSLPNRTEESKDG